MNGNMKNFKEYIKAIVKKVIAEEKTKYTTEQEHSELIDTMKPFLDERPQVGIFWYDYQNNRLFGVKKVDAEDCIKKIGDGTIGKLHKSYWQKEHYRAIQKNETNSIFYNEKNYTLIPRGRLFVKPNGDIFAAVGEWFNGYINGQKVINTQNVRELIADEFNLDDDFEVKIDHHWDIGRGWSEERV